MFFTFDGIDGVGKSTQLGLFVDWLRARGDDVVTCRDPGTTKAGEAIRQILLDVRGAALAARTEMLLYMAARAQLVDEVIAPALAAGRTVVSDRFLLANVVYQGYGRGLDVASLWQVGAIATGGLEPNLTFVLDMPVDAAAGRIGRPLDRMESADAAFRERLRAGFLTEAGRRPQQIAVIDSAREIDEIQREIRDLAAQRLGAGA